MGHRRQHRSGRCSAGHEDRINRRGHPSRRSLLWRSLCPAAFVLFILTGASPARSAPLEDWTHRVCPSEAARAGDPLDPLQPVKMGPHSDLMERAGTFCDIPDEKILHRLRRSSIRQCRYNSGGLSVSLKLELRGSSALFKPTQYEPHSVPRKEIVAYRLNRLLGLNRVPPAVTRRLSLHRFYRTIRDGPSLRKKKLSQTVLYRDKEMRGELSWWIPRIRFVHLLAPARNNPWTKWLTAHHRIPPARYDLAGQISKMLLFDFLMNNQDRFSGGNVVATRDGRRLYFMDNALSLFPEIHQARRSKALRAFFSIERLSLSLINAVAKLTKRAMVQELAKENNRCWAFLATDEELDAMMERRDLVLDRTAELLIRHGWDEVMVFP